MYLINRLLPVGGIRVVELPGDYPTHQQPPVVHDGTRTALAPPEAAHPELGQETHNEFNFTASLRMSASHTALKSSLPNARATCFKELKPTTTILQPPLDRNPRPAGNLVLPEVPPHLGWSLRRTVRRRDTAVCEVALSHPGRSACVHYTTQGV